MSATDILEGLPRLTEAQRQRALEIQARIEALQKELQDLLGRPEAPNLESIRARGIDEEHAAELRARLKTFAEDWERPEADIYDEDTPR